MQFKRLTNKHIITFFYHVDKCSISINHVLPLLHFQSLCLCITRSVDARVFLVISTYIQLFDYPDKVSRQPKPDVSCNDASNSFTTRSSTTWNLPASFCMISCVCAHLAWSPCCFCCVFCCGVSCNICCAHNFCFTCGVLVSISGNRRLYPSICTCLLFGELCPIPSFEPSTF